MALAYAVVCAPVIGELIRVWPDFYPTGDNAVHAIHAHDVFTTRTPLLGMYSGISDPGKPFVYHLGPMVFWALAVPERLFSERLGIVIGAAIVNIVAAVALLRCVRRAVSVTAALAVAAVVAITWWSIGREVLAEPWNPYIAIVPLMLVLVYSFELSNGALAPLPFAALAGSFVIQAHYLYVPVVLASIATGIVLGVAARRGALATGDEPAPPDRRGRRAVITAALVTLVCWSFPLFDEFAHWPGNFSRWIEALRHVQGVQLPASTAWHYVVRAIGWVPLAARGPLPGIDLFDLPFAVGALTTIGAFVVIAVLLATIVTCWKREPRVARFAVTAAVLVPVTWFGVWRLPLSLPVIPVYRIVALWPVGVYVWAAALVGGAAMLRRTEVVQKFDTARSWARGDGRRGGPGCRGGDRRCRRSGVGPPGRPYGLGRDEGASGTDAAAVAARRSLSHASRRRSRPLRAVRHHARAPRSRLPRVRRRERRTAQSRLHEQQSARLDPARDHPRRAAPAG